MLIIVGFALILPLVLFAFGFIAKALFYDTWRYGDSTERLVMVMAACAFLGLAIVVTQVIRYAPAPQAANKPVVEKTVDEE